MTLLIKQTRPAYRLLLCIALLFMGSMQGMQDQTPSIDDWIAVGVAKYDSIDAFLASESTSEFWAILTMLNSASTLTDAFSSQKTVDIGSINKTLTTMEGTESGGYFGWWTTKDATKKLWNQIKNIAEIKPETGEDREKVSFATFSQMAKDTTLGTNLIFKQKFKGANFTSAMKTCLKSVYPDPSKLEPFKPFQSMTIANAKNNYEQTALERIKDAEETNNQTLAIIKEFAAAYLAYITGITATSGDVSQKLDKGVINVCKKSIVNYLNLHDFLTKDRRETNVETLKNSAKQALLTLPNGVAKVLTKALYDALIEALTSGGKTAAPIFNKHFKTLVDGYTKELKTENFLGQKVITSIKQLYSTVANLDKESDSSKKVQLRELALKQLNLLKNMFKLVAQDAANNAGSYTNEMLDTLKNEIDKISNKLKTSKHALSVAEIYNQQLTITLYQAKFIAAVTAQKLAKNQKVTQITTEIVNTATETSHQALKDTFEAIQKELEKAVLIKVTIEKKISLPMPSSTTETRELKPSKEIEVSIVVGAKEIEKKEEKIELPSFGAGPQTQPALPAIEKFAISLKKTYEAN